MPPRIDDEKRAAILQDVRDGGTCRGIAKAHGVSPDTVRRIAAEGGVSDAFARADTENATRARQADMAELRSQVSEKFLRKANELLDDMDRPHTVFAFGGKENSYNEHTLERPPTGDLRNLMTSAAVAADKHLKIVAADAGSGAESAASMLSGIGDALRVAAEQMAEGAGSGEESGE